MTDLRTFRTGVTKMELTMNDGEPNAHSRALHFRIEEMEKYIEDFQDMVIRHGLH
jgi:hypothetical protein